MGAPALSRALRTLRSLAAAKALTPVVSSPTAPPPAPFFHPVYAMTNDQLLAWLGREDETDEAV